jgi:hypothetical protein
MLVIDAKGKTAAGMIHYAGSQVRDPAGELFAVDTSEWRGDGEDSDFAAWRERYAEGW